MCFLYIYRYVWYIYIHEFVCVHIYIYIYIYIHEFVCRCIYIYIHTYIHYAKIRRKWYGCPSRGSRSVFMFYIHTYVCMDMHTHKHTYMRTGIEESSVGAEPTSLREAIALVSCLLYVWVCTHTHMHACIYTEIRRKRGGRWADLPGRGSCVIFTEKRKVIRTWFVVAVRGHAQDKAGACARSEVERLRYEGMCPRLYVCMCVRVHVCVCMYACVCFCFCACDMCTCFHTFLWREQSRLLTRRHTLGLRLEHLIVKACACVCVCVRVCVWHWSKAKYIHEYILFQGQGSCLAPNWSQSHKYTCAYNIHTYIYPTGGRAAVWLRSEAKYIRCFTGMSQLMLVCAFFMNVYACMPILRILDDLYVHMHRSICMHVCVHVCR
jgi:hypothetical protein